MRNRPQGATFAAADLLAGADRGGMAVTRRSGRDKGHRGLVQCGSVRVVELDAAALDWIIAFLERYASLGAQMADAAVMYIAEREGIDTVFTLDRPDFSVYRTTDGRAPGDRAGGLISVRRMRYRLIAQLAPGAGQSNPTSSTISMAVMISFDPSAKSRSATLIHGIRCRWIQSQIAAGSGRAR